MHPASPWGLTLRYKAIFRATDWLVVWSCLVTKVPEKLDAKPGHLPDVQRLLRWCHHDALMPGSWDILSEQGGVIVTSNDIIICIYIYVYTLYIYRESNVLCIWYSDITIHVEWYSFNDVKIFLERSGKKDLPHVVYWGFDRMLKDQGKEFCPHCSIPALQLQVWEETCYFGNQGFNNFNLQTT